MSQLKLKTAALRRCLDTVRPALDRKVTIPILSTVKIESRDGALSMLATNLDHSIRVQTQEPYSGAAMAIVGERMTTWVKLQDADEVKMAEQTNSRVKLSCGRGGAQVPTLPAESFPPVNMPADGNSITMRQGELLQGLKLVAFAIPDSEGQYSIKGALLEVVNGELRMVATDGHRLSLYRVPVEGAPANSLLLPSGLCKLLLGMLTDTDETVTLMWDERSIGVRAMREGLGLIEMTSQRLSVQFPNYSAVVPSSRQYEFEIPAADLNRAIQRSAAFSEARSTATKFTFAPDGVQVYSVNAEAGEANDFVEVQTGIPQHLVVGLNGAYMADALSKIPGDVRIGLTSSREAVVLNAKPSEGTSLTYVVMPMNIPQ